MRRRLLRILVLLLASAPLGAQRAPVANWSFEQGGDGDEIRGFRSFVPGVAGTGLRFDGQTTTVIRKAARMGRLGPSLLGRGLGRDPGIPVDLVRHRQPGAWAQGGLFLRHRIPKAGSACSSP